MDKYKKNYIINSRAICFRKAFRTKAKGDTQTYVFCSVCPRGTGLARCFVRRISHNCNRLTRLEFYIYYVKIVLQTCRHAYSLCYREDWLLPYADRDTATVPVSNAYGLDFRDEISAKIPPFECCMVNLSRGLVNGGL